MIDRLDSAFALAYSLGFECKLGLLIKKVDLIFTLYCECIGREPFETRLVICDRARELLRGPIQCGLYPIAGTQYMVDTRSLQHREVNTVSILVVRNALEDLISNRKNPNTDQTFFMPTRGFEEELEAIAKELWADTHT
jgi:hypothetical protein